MRLGIPGWMCLPNSTICFHVIEGELKPITTNIQTKMTFTTSTTMFCRSHSSGVQQPQSCCLASTRDSMRKILRSMRAPNSKTSFTKTTAMASRISRFTSSTPNSRAVVKSFGRRSSTGFLRSSSRRNSHGRYSASNTSHTIHVAFAMQALNYPLRNMDLDWSNPRLTEMPWSSL